MSAIRFLFAVLDPRRRRLKRAGARFLISACLICFLGLELPETRLSSRLDSAGFQSSEGRNDGGNSLSGQSSRIPFELEANHVILQGTVNGSGPFSFALDTAASWSAMSLKLAKALGLPLRGGGHTEGAGGRVEAAQVSSVSLSLPGATLSNLDIAAFSFEGLERHSGRPLDIILGYELFRRYVVEIDFAAKYINLFEPKTYEYDGNGEIIPLAFHENLPHVRASIETPGQKPITDKFVIDVGSGYPVSLQRHLIDKHQLRLKRGTIETHVTGVGGSIPVTIGRLSRLRLGRFSIQAALTMYPSTRRGVFALSSIAGNIGTGVLRRFKVTFDYARARMILEPNSEFHQNDEYDMSGVRLVAEGPNLKDFRIAEILEASPAKDAGLQVGDLIVELDGRPASEVGIGKLRELFKQDDRDYYLKVKRGDKALGIKLRTRRLV